MSEMKPKIYVFPRKDHGTSGKTYQALAEDGTPLGSHISSNFEYIKKDILLHIEDFEAHYPDGYDLILIDSCNEEIYNVLSKNIKKYGKLNIDHPNNARIKIVLVDDDGKEFTMVIE